MAGQASGSRYPGAGCRRARGWTALGPHPPSGRGSPARRTRHAGPIAVTAAPRADPDPGAGARRNPTQQNEIGVGGLQGGAGVENHRPGSRGARMEVGRESDPEGGTFPQRLAEGQLFAGELNFAMRKPSGDSGGQSNGVASCCRPSQARRYQGKLRINELSRDRHRKTRL